MNLLSSRTQARRWSRDQRPGVSNRTARPFALYTPLLVFAILAGALLNLVSSPAHTTSAAVGNLHATVGNLHLPTTGRIAAENALPGTDSWASVGNYSINSLSAYSGAVSVNAGDPISIYANSSGSTLSANLYRLGYYQNHGARLYTTYSGISTPPQPACTRDTPTGLVRCPWASTFTINTDPNWISGIYLLRLDSDNGYRFFVYFTVRNDSYNSDIVVMEPTKTNEAYNRYGGESLYYSGNNEGRIRAYKVSFDRPYNSGAGTGSLFTHDVEMVRWLEASGYDVTYISDVDRATNPNILLGHRVALDMGHDEYWSWGERDNVEGAVASGVNLIFLSGNESYWNARLESSPVGSARIITCYKDSNADPTHTPPGVTVSFDDPLLNRPENSLVGVGYESWYDDALYNAPWVVSAPPTNWYFNCTGITAGDHINNIVGEEWDAIHNNGHTPPNTEILSSGVVYGNNGLPYPQNSVMYTASSGAKVFAAGSIHWSWGLIDHSYANQVFEPYAISNDADHRIEQFTANIIDRFAGYWDGQPRPCGPANQGFYDIGVRPTRTAKPQAPTATGTPPTATRTPISTSTNSPTYTRTSSPTGTMTFTSTPSNTPPRTITGTPTTPPSSTATNSATNTPASTNTATTTMTNVASQTSTPTRTGTSTNAPSGTPVYTRTATSSLGSVTPAATASEPANTGTPAATATACLSLFTDVPVENTFYPYVRCLACRGIVAGYACGGTNPLTGYTEPCDSNNSPYFRYNNPITRGQISKLVSNAAGFVDDPGPQLFEDAPAGSPFYSYINRLANRGVMGGYACGTRADEPCITPGNRPYFRPNSNASRGQLSKIISNAAGFTEGHTEQTFEDVNATSAFYIFVQRLASRGAMAGYACGGINPEGNPGGGAEPCGDRNLPYFRPGNMVTRGQSSKITSNIFFPVCQTPYGK